MLELAHEINFARFRGHSLIELLMRGGLSSGSVFERWLDGVLEGRRFEDLELDLAVVATDVRASRPVIFERATTPTMKVARAVRFSMGIPLLFSFQAYEGALLVDGSILSEDALHREWTSDGTPVCVFRLRSEQSGRPLPMNGWFPLIGYTHMLIRTFMTTISREFVDAKHWPRTVVIDSGPLSPLEFRLDRTQKNDLYQRGYQTTRNILPLKFKFSPRPPARRQFERGLSGARRCAPRRRIGRCRTRPARPAIAASPISQGSGHWRARASIPPCARAMPPSRWRSTGVAVVRRCRR